MNLVEVIGLVITSGIAMRVVEHFLTRKMSKKAEVKNHIENIDFAGETWQKVVDRLEERIEKLLKQITELQDENVKFREEIYKLHAELVSLKTIQEKADKYEKQIKKLQEKIAYYERLLTDNNISY
ncbi:MAG: hypothetical protein LBT56_00010 [Prevotellaceae bacterium]|jgi:peptidoglycan hydrolase CwlO-like protein|nr:hypothetical protein [Prevotellaceae bacterium]